ncbi:MAG TPA: beta/gamma crystallin-related protein [Rhizomicrobium sp.]|nr:beta/gamma crystallin-related protein [Rhizomicrobium sp.]
MKLGYLAAAAVMALYALPGAAQAGGCRAVVYWDIDYGGERFVTDHDVSYVGDHWNDKISSIKVISGEWEFFWDANYGGEALRLGPGRYRYVGDHWNDQISSFRCVRPTG